MAAAFPLKAIAAAAALTFIVVPASYAGGFLGDIVNQIAPGVGTQLDQVHDQIKQALPPYKAVEEGASHVVREVEVQASAPILKNWIIESRNQAIRDGVEPIPHEIRTNLAAYVPADILDRVRFRVGSGGDLSLQQNSFRYGDAAAITLDYVVVFENANDAYYNPGLWAHELKHVMQYRDWGLEDFSIRYLRNSGDVESEAVQYAEGWAARSISTLASQAPSAPTPLGNAALNQPLFPVGGGPGNVCSTPMGSCVLPGQAPAGTGCWCNTPFGGVTGSIIPMMQQISLRPANVCATPTGTCMMLQSIPENSPCYCQTPFGGVPGMAQVVEMVPARFCATPNGACPMGVPVAPGSPCGCPTPFGPIGGVAVQ